MSPQLRVHTIQRSARIHTTPVVLCFPFFVSVPDYGGFDGLLLTRCRCSLRRCWWLSPRIPYACKLVTAFDMVKRAKGDLDTAHNKKALSR